MTKIARSGSISQRHGSTDPDQDPNQIVMDPEHCSEVRDPAKYRRRAGGQGGRQAGREASRQAGRQRYRTWASHVRAGTAATSLSSWQRTSRSFRLVSFLSPCTMKCT
jgi:hypothetical protein